ncbi:hypothetical protein FACS1894170_13510 [Planctomycetales bacterium]|nr:hypothetical protein FACS1894170_13510 [Planctomycetales bacterium]
MSRFIHESTGLANGPSDWLNSENGPVYDYGFGSYHPGVCLFAIGDASVQNIQNSVAISILVALTDVSDGATVSLP